MNATYNTNNSIKLYTLTEAEKIIDYRRKNELKYKKEIATYYIKQKLCGLVLIITGIILPFLLNGEATVSLFLFPLGLFLIFTKEKCFLGGN